MSRRKNILYNIFLFPVAARPKAFGCNRSLVETAGSNLTVGMDTCPQVRCHYSTRGVLLSVAYLNVIVKHGKKEALPQ